MARGDYLAKTGGGYGKSYQQKTDNLKQSIGSLDRRINKAIASGDTDQAKDLRSRQKKFVKDLAMNTVKQQVFGGDDELTVQGNIRTSSGGPVLTTKGGELRQSVIDRDFLNPTKRLQNQFPGEMKRMYPVETAAQQGPFAVQAIKKMFGMEDKPIPYSGDGIMPALRYPLDEQNMAAAEGSGIFSNEGDFNVASNVEDAVNSGEYRLINAGSLNDGLGLLIDQGAVSPNQSNNLNLGNLFGNFQDGIGAFGLDDNPIVQGFRKLDDNKGLDVDIGNKSLRYTTETPFNLPGNVTFSLDPNNAGIMYEI